MELDYEINHRAGVKYQAADALSLFSRNGTDDKDIDEVPLLAIQRQSRKDEHQLRCSCRECDDTAVNFEPHSLLIVKSEDVEVPTITKLLLVRFKNAFRNQMRQSSRTPNCLVKFDKNELLVRQAAHVSSVQKLVPINLPPIILYFACNPTLVGHPGE